MLGKGITEVLREKADQDGSCRGSLWGARRQQEGTQCWLAGRRDDKGIQGM